MVNKKENISTAATIHSASECNENYNQMTDKHIYHFNRFYKPSRHNKIFH